MENNSNNQEFVFTNPEETPTVPTERIVTCEHCGITLSESEMTRVKNGNYVCDDCLNSGDYTRCEFCGEIVYKAYVKQVVDKDHNIHEGCVACIVERYRRCDVCGNWVPIDEIRPLENGGFICDECFNNPEEDWIECENCHEVLHESESHTAVEFRFGDGHEITICDSCRRHDFRTCANCGELVRYDDLSDSVDGYICPGCIDEYIRCYNCGTYIREDEAYYDDEDNVYYCPSCYGSNSLIRGYHQAPPRRFYGEMPFGKQGHFGYELEIDRDDRDIGDERALTRELVDIAGDRIYFEHDGSLNCGFEIISQPHTYEAMMDDMPIEEILEACRRYGYKSHSAGTCGLHFHISRQFFGTIRYRDTAIEKMMYFYDTYYDEVRRFARRSEGQLHWCNKNSSEDNKCLCMKEKHLKYNGILKDDKDHEDRYVVVNTTNHDTVEIRIMRGTLKYTTFMASFDFIYTIAKNSKCITWNSVDDLSQWFKGMKSETLEYMKSRDAFPQYFDGQKGE